MRTIAEFVDAHIEEILAVRRYMHMHPELSHEETRTTEVLAEKLTDYGMRPRKLRHTGLLCDIGAGGPIVGLRAELDALPIMDESRMDFRSVVANMAHACGHDIHAASVFGAGLILKNLSEAGELRGRVRLIFQPAEESHPGGSFDVIAGGGLDDVERLFALHCDPSLDVGMIGWKTGTITSAAGNVNVRAVGSGGHTARPHQSEDVILALSRVAVEIPVLLSRKCDPRSGASLVWGVLKAGEAPNAMPAQGELLGILRCLQGGAWQGTADLVPGLVDDIVRPFGVTAVTECIFSKPATVNERASVAAATRGITLELGSDALTPVEQSLGGEDVSWLFEKVPGALLRLGSRSIHGKTFDLHQPDFVADEGAVAIGVRALVSAVLESHNDLEERQPTG